MKDRKVKKLLELKKLSNGIIIPTEEVIISVHDIIIEDRKLLGKNDPISIRDQGLIKHLCDTLIDRPHKYSGNVSEDALYVATETFYFIACEHPFIEANKSTGYVCSLLLLHVNLSKDEPIKSGSPSHEAEEIVKLAEGGKDPKEVRKLIKKFLQKEISG
ncbi:Fic family protein [Candidatus Micrarchaeota archaeon]|nr:Fic family protein [Candidatus Micrarchaeota archaeon]